VIVKNGLSTVLLVYQRHGCSKLSVSCLKVVCLYTAVIVSTTMMIHDQYAKEVDHLDRPCYKNAREVVHLDQLRYNNPKSRHN
jgi:hypothetical protein